MLNKKAFMFGVLSATFAGAVIAADKPESSESPLEVIWSCQGHDGGRPVEATGNLVRGKKPEEYMLRFVPQNAPKGSHLQTFIGPIPTRQELDGIGIQVCKDGKLNPAQKGMKP